MYRRLCALLPSLLLLAVPLALSWMVHASAGAVAGAGMADAEAAAPSEALASDPPTAVALDAAVNALEAASFEHEASAP